MHARDGALQGVADLHDRKLGSMELAFYLSGLKNANAKCRVFRKCKGNPEKNPKSLEKKGKLTLSPLQKLFVNIFFRI